MTDLATGLLTLNNTAPDYAKGQCYYTGETSETFSNTQIQRKLAKNGDIANLRLNFSRLVVDAVANRIDLQAISSPDSAANEALATISKSNQLDLELPGLFLKTLYFGDSFLILDGDADTGISLFYNSPMNVQVIYSDENPRLKEYAIKKWVTNDPTLGSIIRVNLYYPDRIERYYATAKSKGKKESDFLTFEEGTIPNPYGFIPVYHFRTSLHGTPEHREAYSPQDAINKLAITHLATVDYLGFPQRYLKNSDPLAAGEIDDFDAAIFHDSAVPQATDLGPDMFHQRTYPNPPLKSDPGGLWMLPAGSDAGQFAAAGSKDFLDSLDTYIKIMAQVTFTPLRYLESQAGNISGETLRVSDEPLIKKVLARIASFEASLHDCLTDALAVLGISAQIVLHWEPAQSNNSADTWTVVTQKIAAGVSQRQALSEVGYPDDVLNKMGITDDTSTSLAARARALLDIGKAVQSLSIGVTAGILSPEDVSKIVMDMLTEDD